MQRNTNKGIKCTELFAANCSLRKCHERGCEVSLESQSLRLQLFKKLQNSIINDACFGMVSWQLHCVFVLKSQLFIS